MLLREMFDNGKIPKYYTQFFPPMMLCECGRPLSVTDNLSKIYCDNPQCVVKKAKRLNNILEHIGIKGYSTQSLKKIVANLDTYKLVPQVLELSSDLSTQLLQYYNNTPHSIRELTRSMCFQNSSIISKAMRSINSLSEFGYVYGSGGKLHVILADRNRRKLSPQFIVASNELAAHMYELATILKRSNIKEVDKSYNVMMTGDINPFIDEVSDLTIATKLAYIEYLNRITNNKIEVNLVEAFGEADYIINDNPNSNTPKYLKGLELGILISSQSFKDLIRKEYLNNGK